MTADPLCNKGVIDDKIAMIAIGRRIFRKNVPTSNAQQSCIASLHQCSRLVAHILMRVFEEIMYFTVKTMRLGGDWPQVTNFALKDNLVISYYTHPSYSWLLMEIPTRQHFRDYDYSLYCLENEISFSVLFTLFFSSIMPILEQLFHYYYFDKGENKILCTTRHITKCQGMLSVTRNVMH